MRKLFTLIAVSLFAMAGMAQTVVFKETFDGCNKAGGNDGTWSGLSGTSNVVADNEGWTNYKANAANQCVRFGTAKDAGFMQTPTITLNGNGTITFKAGAWKGDQATITVEVSGATLVDNSTISIANEKWTDVTLSLTGAEGNVKVKFLGSGKNNRLFLDEIVVTENIKISDLGYATAYTNTAYTLPEGLTAYIVKENGGNIKLETIEGKNIAANSAILVKGAEGSYPAIPTTETGAVLTGNLLKGVLTEMTVSASAGNKIYILNNGANGAGFYWQQGSNEGDKATVPAGRCYLDVAITGAAGAQGLSFESLLTGIQTVEKVSNSADIYDLAGRRVQQVGRGLYIVDGKKVIR